MTQSVVHCTAVEEVAHYKPREEMGDKLIMEAGHLSDLLSRANCVQFSPILHLASQLVFLALGPDLRNHHPACCVPMCPSQWSGRGSRWKFAPKISYKTIACGTVC